MEEFHPNFSVIPRDSLIFQYCNDGNLEGVKQLFGEKTASPNDCDEYGFTALHRAAALRHVPICQLLLQNAANANAASFVTGETPLHHLPINRSRTHATELLEIVRILVGWGSTDPTMENSSGQNACHAFEAFFAWPGHIALRNEMAKCLARLRSDTEQPPRDETIEGRLYNEINIDPEVENLDLMLKSNTDFRRAFGPDKCPGSYLRAWNVFHVLMHLRVEPVWHPWSTEAILQQKTLWSEPMGRMLRQKIDSHAVDWEGNMSSSLAMRSLFTFHVWQNALVAEGTDMWDFVRRELEICPALVQEGWDLGSLHVLFTTRTERLYLHQAEWRENPQTFTFANSEDDGLYMHCCWFQLLDILKHRNVLPRGWKILTSPRQFYRPRSHRYWHPSTGTLQTERSVGGTRVDMESLSERQAEGQNLVDELASFGVVWQETKRHGSFQCVLLIVSRKSENVRIDASF